MKLNENDIKYLTKKVQSYVIMEMDNAAQRIAVIKNIFYKHHSLDPKFTWEDAIERYKKMHQDDLEKYPSDFDAQDVSDEIENYKGKMAAAADASKKREKEMDLSREKDAEDIKQKVEAIAQEMGVQNVKFDSKYGYTYVTLTLGEDMCNGFGVNKEFFIPMAQKAIQLHNVIASKFELYKNADWNYKNRGLLCCIPGMDSGSAYPMYGNEFLRYGFNEASPEEMFELTKQSQYHDRIVRGLEKVTAVLKLSFYDDSISKAVLGFDGEFNEEGKKDIARDAQEVADIIDYERRQGWSLDESK